MSIPLKSFGAYLKKALAAALRTMKARITATTNSGLTFIPLCCPLLV